MDDNSQRLRTNHHHHPGVSSPGNNLLSGTSSSGRSRGRRIWHRICDTSRVSNRVVRAALSSGDLIDSTCIINEQHSSGLKHGSDDEVRTSQTENSANSSPVKTTAHIQVKNPSGHTQQQQYNKIKMKDDPVPLLKKSGSSKTPVSKLSKQKQEITEPPKDPTSLFRRSGTSRIPESKQLPVMGATQPLKDPAGLAKTSTISRARALMHVVKKEKAQPPKNPTDLVKNGGTRTIQASMHAMQKTETAKTPKDPAGLVKNIGTSRIPASMHSMQKKETTQSPKDSAALVKKSETTSSKSGTGRTLPSKLVTQKKETTPAKPGQKQQTYEDHIAKPRQKQHAYKHHLVWEGFNERIMPLGKSCLLCDGDLANEPEYDPDIERQNPAENAVLSCGHVFHSLCLLFITSEEKFRDPPCIICASIMS